MSLAYRLINRRHGWFSSPFLGTFFQCTDSVVEELRTPQFSSPFLGTFFQSNRWLVVTDREGAVFVPFLGDFLSIACLRSPSPSALASAFAAGMGESLHQALSFGDEMPIFPVRTGIGGDLQ